MCSLGNSWSATVFKRQTALTMAFTTYSPSVASPPTRSSGNWNAWGRSTIQHTFSILTYRFPLPSANWLSHSRPRLAPHWLTSWSLCGSRPCWCPCLHAFAATLSVMITSFLEGPVPKPPLSWSLYPC